VINESVSLRMHGHGFMFGELYREKQEGLSRPRLNESSIDPDLLLYSRIGGEKSNIYDRWNAGEARRTFDFLPERRSSVIFSKEKFGDNPKSR